MVVTATAACPAMPYDAQPPPELEAGASTTTNVSTFAFDAIFLGDILATGGLSNTAWKTFGYDLDGKTTTKASTDVCTLAPGTPRFYQVDGLDGRDNSFGSTILPIVEALTSNQPFDGFCGSLLEPPCSEGGPPYVPLTNDETQAIKNGKFTLQIQIVGLSDDPAQSADGLSTQVFSSDSFGSPPAFDDTTDWPVLSDSLVDPSTIASGAKARFTSSYVNHGTFVAGASELVTVPLHAEIQGSAFTLMVHSALITFDHVDPVTGASGVLAGVLDVQELTEVFRGFFTGLSTTFCGAAFDGIAEQIASGSDIFMDRTNAPGAPCTGVSFAIGFHARRIANPTMIATPKTLVDPCALPSDAGTD
jgi:hypothetical protein